MLDINIEFRKGILFVRLDGILNRETVNKLNTEVLNIIKINGIKYIVLNLENLIYIDAYGINSIMNHYNMIKLYNGKALICGVNNEIVKSKIMNSDILDYFSPISNEINALNLIKI